MRAYLVCAPIAFVALLAGGTLACSGSDAPTVPSDSNAAPGSSGTGGSGSTGTLAIHITDSPFSEAKALLVTFSEVTVHRADPGEWRTLTFASGSTRTCDLKKLNGATDVLGVGSLPTGKYTQVRLNVSSAAIYFDGPSTGPAWSAVIAPPGGASASGASRERERRPLRPKALSRRRSTLRTPRHSAGRELSPASSVRACSPRGFSTSTPCAASRSSPRLSSPGHSWEETGRPPRRRWPKL